MSWLKKLFGKTAPTPLPPTSWKTEASIFHFIQQHLQADGSLAKAGWTLPDEEQDSNTLKFAPGMLDNMVGTDESQEAQEQVQQLVDLLSLVAHHGTEQAKAAFYKKVTQNEGVVGIIDEFLEGIVQENLPVAPHLYAYALDLMLHTRHRNAVKFGIAILGLCDDKTVVKQLKIVGVHDEFTLYASVALYHLSDNLVQDLWHLAKQVDGWGRIQLVERLVQLELTQEIRDWLIYEGYQNSILYQYLVLPCAINGQLDERLSASKIDARLFKNATVLLATMIEDGPVEAVGNYEDAATTFSNYLRHASQHFLDITHFVFLHDLKKYLEYWSKEEGDYNPIQSWSNDQLSDCLIDVAALLQSKDWEPLARAALQQEQQNRYWYGVKAAELLGLDIWKELWARLQREPLTFNAWFDVVQHARPEHATAILDFARQALPLRELGSGPDNQFGLGEDFDTYSSLQQLLEFLKAYPTQGEDLILIGLNCPVTFNRNSALRTLEAWTAAHWSPAIRKALHLLRNSDPDVDVRARVGRLLSGEPLEGA